MDLLQASPRQRRVPVLVLAGCLTALLTLGGSAVDGHQGKVDFLHIGATESLTTESGDRKKADAALESLRSFIKDETGFNNDITRVKTWQDLVDKMAKGHMQVGVFQGYEFAWAQEKAPELKPLAITVNTYRYPIVYVVVKRDSPIKGFADLQGKSIALPDNGQAYLRLFAEKEAEAQGKTLKTLVAKIDNHENFEDALDDVVDGKVQAAVVDRAALEGFKRRKPGRFDQLKQIAHSPPLPPSVIAYYGKLLDAATLKRFQDGLLNAHRNDRGQTMLTLFHLTAIETPPSDFGEVLADARKTFPPSGGKGK